MKRFIFLLSFIVFAFAACEEIPPVVTGASGGDQGPTAPTDQKRQVLIEEFTGVRCVNCPNGSIIIEDLLAVYGQQLVAISIHTGNFAFPFNESAYDFRTQEGDNLLNYVGTPFGFPSAVVNRTQYPGQVSTQLGPNDWAGFIAEEAALPPQVKIDIQPIFNDAGRNAKVDVTLFVEETIDEPDVRLSVIFTENDIVDYQLTPDSSPDYDPNYKHKHVFRGMATPFDGVQLTEGLTVGQTIERSFDYDIPTEWAEENVNIVVVVSLAGSEKDVIQVHEVHLVN